MTQDKVSALGAINLFAGLPPKILGAVERRCSWREYGPNEQIIDRQSDTKDVYFITRGRVRVVNYSLSGREVTFDDFGEGACFGELAAIDNQPRSANVVALDPTTVAIMSPEVFREILKEYPPVVFSLLTRLSRIVRNSTERIMDLSTLGANNRVYAELLRLATPNTRNDNSAEIKPIPIHGDIASRVSTTRETVARVLGDLSRKDIVRRQKDRLVILDIDRLREMVEQFQSD